MRDVTDASFGHEVLQADRPVVVDFWAPWCGPCRAVTPILRQLEAEHGARVAFVKVNIDDYPVAAARYGVLSIPTAILFDGGHPQVMLAGARPRSDYEREWSRWLAPSGRRE